MSKRLIAAVSLLTAGGALAFALVFGAPAAPASHGKVEAGACYLTSSGRTVCPPPSAF
jgi:hypothetical protein